jgi:glycerol-3-phosphate dehydrogenase
MAWWDDVLNLLRDEFSGGSATSPAPSEPATARQAEALLKRTTRELLAAKARAEAARRRMARAQDELLALTRNEKLRASYRERLTALAKAVTHESELVRAFDAHIARLSEVHLRVQHEFDKFERDLQMARTAHVTAAATQQVKPDTKPAPSDAKPGFRRTRDNNVLDELKRGPQKPESTKPGSKK